MASHGRKSFFNVLGTSTAGTDGEFSMSSSSSNPPQNVPAAEILGPKKKKKRKKSRKSMTGDISVAEKVSRNGPDVETSSGFGLSSYSQSMVETSVVLEAPERRSASFVVCTATPSPRLRKRNLSSGVSAESESEIAMLSGTEESRGNDGNENEDERKRGNEAEELQQQHVPVEMNQRNLEKSESLDWKQLMNEDQTSKFFVFLEEFLILYNLQKKLSIHYKKKHCAFPLGDDIG